MGNMCPRTTTEPKFVVFNFSPYFFAPKTFTFYKRMSRRKSPTCPRDFSMSQTPTSKPLLQLLATFFMQNRGRPTTLFFESNTIFWTLRTLMKWLCKGLQEFFSLRGIVRYFLAYTFSFQLSSCLGLDFTLHLVPCHFSYTIRSNIMGRRSKFNNGRKRWNASALKLQAANTSMLQNSPVCSACGEMESSTIQLQLENTFNELFCFACLKHDNPPKTWWRGDDPTAPENDDAAFDDDWVDSPLHTLVNNQTWEEAICQWQKNMELVPSKGGGKTQYYSKVHAGNKLGKFCYEPSAHK